MSLPAHADSVVNCSPVSCMPSPESPAKRTTARSSSFSDLPLAGAAVSLIDARLLARFQAHAQTADRSEEHTSELQSRLHLVCRLLLEKKKTTTKKQG